MQPQIPSPNSAAPRIPEARLRTQIDSQLERILQSKAFERASRLRGLLEYLVVNKTLGRDPDEVRIAIEFFGKPRDFEPTLDPGIRVQIGRLRKALSKYYREEGAEDPIRISIPPRTYTPEITILNPDRMDGSGRTRSHDGDDGRTNRREFRGNGGELVVLPFSNLTNNEKHTVFCYGLTEEIASALGNRDGYRVVANSSAFQFKDVPVDVRKVGRQLGAAYVLEGSVRMEKGNVRVTAQLARTADGMAIWSNTFDVKVQGTLATQSAVARRIAETLPPASPVTDNVDSTDDAEGAGTLVDYLEQNELLRSTRT